MRINKALAVLFVLLPLAASAQIIPTLPVTLTNGTLADANQVMSDFNTIVTGVNTNGAKNGANSDITSLSALTTPLTPAQGGSSVYTGNDIGSANAYNVATLTPTNYTLRSGNTINFIPSFTNTGTATLAAGGTTVTPILRQTSAGLQPLAGGEIFAGQSAQVIYDGVQYELLNSAVSSNTQPCTSIDYAGITVPSGYLAEAGQAVSRTTFAALFSCLAYTSVAATINGTVTVTVANGLIYQPGWFVGGPNVTCNSVIQSVGATTIVLNNPAGAASTTTLTIGPQPQGDCSTTFNVPNMQGRATVMVDGTGTVLTGVTCAAADTIGGVCGSQTQTLTAAQLPTITSTNAAQAISVTVTTSGVQIPTTGAVSQSSFGGTGGGTTVNTASSWSNITSISGTTSNSISTTSTGTTGAAHPIVQPIALVTKAIKF